MPRKTREERNQQWATKETQRIAAREAVLKPLPVAVREDLLASIEVLDELAAELVAGICDAAARRLTWHASGRIGAASSSVAAAASGGALTAGLGGPGGVIFGLAALTLGVVGGIVSAVGADSEYVRERHKERRFEQLWWDIWIYSVNGLAEDDAGARFGRLSAFAQRRADIIDPAA